VVVLFHYMSEVFIFETAKFNPGSLSPIIVSSESNGLLNYFDVLNKK